MFAKWKLIQSVKLYVNVSNLHRLNWAFWPLLTLSCRFVCSLCISWDSNKHSYYLSSPFKSGISLYPNHFRKVWRLLYRIILFLETFDALWTCFCFNWFENACNVFIVWICDTRTLIGLFIHFSWIIVRSATEDFLLFCVPYDCNKKISSFEACFVTDEGLSKQT